MLAGGAAIAMAFHPGGHRKPRGGEGAVRLEATARGPRADLRGALGLWECGEQVQAVQEAGSTVEGTHQEESQQWRVEDRGAAG